jgi:hypothetical protein
LWIIIIEPGAMMHLGGDRDQRGGRGRIAVDMRDDLALVFAHQLRHRDAGEHVAARRIDAQMHRAGHAGERLGETPAATPPNQAASASDDTITS